ncbi:gliding motility-associated C-terminal domain-containing protein [Filimonas lacunae]|uniref:Gliding motility-associated C-terminal domain-containing protein n=1 Tax=Filimonas lacunae TaxID=477680 RepID=A0A173MIE0_9BACT|nr:PKD domain-containing protein [Filimonas lacunae]BAV07178.1 protease precursor [Filimonas lacunae]SIS93737.1 gliding motility-associated C-terminal domain-containing protein [Filimonas lacunae]
MRLALRLNLFKKHFALLSCLIFIHFNTLHAQLTASFTADNISGCSPLTVNFSNTSTGTSASTIYSWSLGNSSSSSDKNAAAIYTEAKSYTVTLTVTDGNKTATSSKTITVNENPVVDFTVSSQKVCSPGNVTFTPAVTNSTITSCTWDFGDGTTTQTNAYPTQHYYPVATDVSISLTVTNSKGCTGFALKNNYIHIAAPVTATFEADKTFLCALGDPLHFTNTSTGGTPLTYSWTFGDGGTATEKEPAHNYTQKGTYSVTLTATDADGCSASATKSSYLNIANYSTDFTVPDLLCQNASLVFNNQSNPINYNAQWSIDGNLTYWSYSSLYTNIYTPGNHTISLTNTFGTCIQTITKTVTVQASPNTTGFITDYQRCDPTMTLHVKDTTAGAVKWEWYNNYNYTNFPNTTQEFTFSYPSHNNYSISLRVSNAAGCSTSVGKNIDFSTPTAYITPTNLDPSSNQSNHHCGKGDFRFTMSDPYLESGDAVSTWNWTFGDGGTSTQAIPEHTYTKAGSYPVNVTFTTSKGCTGTAYTYYYTTIYIDTLIKPDFTASTTSLCGSGYATLTDNLGYYSVSGDYIYRTWYVDNAYNNWGSYYNSNQISLSSMGKHTIKLIVNSGACTDSVIKVNYLEVLPPILETNATSYTSNCEDNRGKINFKLKAEQVDKWEWDYGDGQKATYTILSDTTHTYTKSGSYTVNIKATTGSCSVSRQVYVNVQLKLVPTLSTTATEICKGGDLPFTLQVNPSDPGYLPYNYYYLFNWQYEDGTNYNRYYYSYLQLAPSATGILEKVDSTKQKIRAILQYNGCIDTTNYITLTFKECTPPVIPDPPVTPTQPAVSATVSKTLLSSSKCPPVLVQLSASINVSYTRRVWNFGDGTIVEGTGYTSHVYTRPGKYFITLDVYNNTTLIGTYKDSVVIYQSQTAVTLTNNEGCPGQTVTLQATGSNTSSLIWDFGDGNVQASSAQVTHTYTKAGNYSPAVVEKDAQGCTYYTDAGEQAIIHPIPTIQINPANGATCRGSAVALTATGATNYEWTPATGLNNNQVANPMASPPQTTEYTINGTSQWGCKGSTTYTVEVYQPFSLVLPATASICKGESIQLQASGADTYKWINNTSNLSNTQSATPVANPQSTIQYTLVGYDTHQCFTDTATITVTVNPLPVVDAGKDAEVLVGVPVPLTATSPDVITQWNWQPATYLNCTSCASPVSTPMSQISYVVTGTNQYNCKATDTVTIKMQCQQQLVQIPTGFSPNGDGRNDYFTIKGISFIKHMTIFNRWGLKVFDRSNFIASDQSNCWDGKYNGELQPPGAYVYFIEMQCPDGGVFLRNGTITVIR